MRARRPPRSYAEEARNQPISGAGRPGEGSLPLFTASLRPRPLSRYMVRLRGLCEGGAVKVLSCQQKKALGVMPQKIWSTTHKTPASTT
jgi:hypothetical protein